MLCYYATCRHYLCKFSPLTLQTQTKNKLLSGLNTAHMHGAPAKRAEGAGGIHSRKPDGFWAESILILICRKKGGAFGNGGIHKT
jgi:hypothetical protein